MMTSHGSLFVVLFLGACSGGEFAGFERVAGAPNNFRGLSFDANGRAIGAVVNGLDQYALTREGDWRSLAFAGVPLTNQTRFTQANGTLYMTLTTQLLKLDDVDAFTWSQIEPDYGTLIGADADGRLYENSGNSTDIRRLAEGDSAWTRVAFGAFPLGGHAVLPNGSVFFDSPNSGLVYRATVETGTQLFADCATTEGCKYGFGVAGADRDNNVYMLECPQIFEGRDHRFVWKIANGTEPPARLAPLPDAYPYCLSLQPLADGTLMLVAATDNLETGISSIFMLAPGDDTFVDLTPDTYVPWGYQYVARDSSTVYGWADGEAQTGLIRASR